MAKVTLDKVKKRFGALDVIKGVDLTIEDGEFVVLVGPSGCGKSTLLRMIAGLEEITGGEIAIGDKVVNDLEPRERDIAMVFQSYALYPHMDVARNMAFSMALRKTPQAEIDAAVSGTASALELDSYLDRLPRALSGGQRQRVAMGRAIVRRPKVFLFDEPLSNLDAQLRVQMRTEVRKLHQTIGATSIYVTHDQVEAMTMADRIVVLDKGRIAQVGSPLDLYDRPANRFVAEFIGSPSINLIKGAALEGAIDQGTAGAGAALSEALHRNGGNVVAGIRPEHLQPAEQGLRGTVQVIENLGAETYVFFDAGTGRDLCWRTPGRAGVRIGEVLTLGVDPNHLHVFDAESGARL
ncbi:ABC transporter ATP-binding protein [Rhizobium sp. SSA_523]|uniref:ABC transporter ATP-binding protein n=1 Tax=Rhizobium sp. SSA_523 TaxID=2952477 RepID=UPI002090BC91|nr:sn-glycerol-3-phosphate ABC transporter ATP-binding protein UgpC [Rhizobium sp. SSA_523]MCO5734171.1 sn-glycerol-3-phosphate ABC transporter ATP-binding protein UgpC [Rhizobium sp. SSA_523]WKC21548.1 sn-glycerol-3-phosphate ABC transporter ATP-binding protein UgpC [Rhizobium sp. SSA_523]